MIVFLKSQPIFTEVGTDPEYNGIWALFKDGVPLVIPNGQLAPGSGRSLESLPAEKSMNAAEGNIPESNLAWSQTGLTDCYNSPASSISSRLNGNGYNSNYQTLTVDNMKTVKNAGVLYIDAHGYSTKASDGGQIFTIRTQTIVNQDTQTRYREDIRSGRLVFITQDLEEKFLYPNCSSNNVYFGITDRFIVEYNSFSRNSFVLINACLSSDSLMSGAFISKGASLYVGWNNKVNASVAFNAANVLINGLLGNQSQQKSLDWQTMQAQINNPNLIFVPGNNNFGVLAPSIESAVFNPNNNTITLKGIFGSDPGNKGQIMINNNAYPVPANISWGASQIIFPAYAEPDNNYSISVIVRGHKSNVIRLDGLDSVTYKYEGPIFNSFDSQPGAGPKPENPYVSCKITATVKVLEGDGRRTVISGIISDGVNTFTSLGGVWTPGYNELWIKNSQVSQWRVGASDIRGGGQVPTAVLLMQQGKILQQKFSLR